MLWSYFRREIFRRNVWEKHWQCSIGLAIFFLFTGTTLIPPLLPTKQIQKKKIHETLPLKTVGLREQRTHLFRQGTKKLSAMYVEQNIGQADRPQPEPGTSRTWGDGTDNLKQTGSDRSQDGVLQMEMQRRTTLEMYRECLSHVHLASYYFVYSWFLYIFLSVYLCILFRVVTMVIVILL